MSRIQKTDFSKLKKGSILSETQFYVVNAISKTDVSLICEDGSTIEVNKKYAEDLLDSADQFTSVEEKTATELAEILLKSSRIALEVCYIKQGKEKSKTKVKQEIEQWTKDAQKAFLDKGLKGLEEYALKPVQTYEPGEMRIIRGRHYADKVNDMGRIDFIDMEIERGSTSYDNSIRQVDTRTIQYIIKSGVKYIKKK